MKRFLILLVCCAFTILVRAQQILPDPGLPIVTIGIATATDPERDPLRWEITSGNRDNFFSISSTTGKIICKKTAWQSFTRQRTFYLRLKCSDPYALYDRAYLTVTLRKWTEGETMPWPYKYEIYH